ncbi:MAG: heavy-metal-associated domain-containing protein [Burkholderiales bacterium]|nr:heavy-metal-associated domain-containing protein [Burkholderiales bacterium]
MTQAQTYTLSVKGMSCQHCVKAVTQAVQSIDPRATVTVDLPGGQVSVTSATLERAAVVKAINEEGYVTQP